MCAALKASVLYLAKYQKNAQLLQKVGWAIFIVRVESSVMFSVGSSSDSPKLSAALNHYKSQICIKDV
jgi:hypothetical protein